LREAPVDTHDARTFHVVWGKCDEYTHRLAFDRDGPKNNARLALQDPRLERRREAEDRFGFVSAKVNAGAFEACAMHVFIRKGADVRFVKPKLVTCKS
jgi:hypothetical protein